MTKDKAPDTHRWVNNGGTWVYVPPGTPTPDRRRHFEADATGTLAEPDEG